MKDARVDLRFELVHGVYGKLFQLFGGPEEGQRGGGSDGGAGTVQSEVGRLETHHLAGILRPEEAQESKEGPNLVKSTLILS